MGSRTFLVIPRSVLPFIIIKVQKVLFKANQVIKPFAGLFFFIKNAERWIGRFIRAATKRLVVDSVTSKNVGDFDHLPAAEVKGWVIHDGHAGNARPGRAGQGRAGQGSAVKDAARLHARPAI